MPRSGRTPLDVRQLVAATRPFIKESPARSWYYVISTWVILIGAMVGAALAPWPWRLVGTVVASMVLIRGFILYHDHLHGALLRKSKVARALFILYGLLVLTPSRAWRRSHNFHHAHVGKIEHSDIGNFWLMTTHMWNDASRWTRIYYRFSRSIWVILLAYPVVFGLSITTAALVRDPKRHWDSAVSLALHGGLITGLWLWQGAVTALLVVMIPMAVSMMIGTYFFYAQHSYVGMDILPDEEWSVPKAAIASCSYLKLGRLMKWISGDIGYHHVHHLNAAIPFYRLADAKRAIPQLKDPIITTLRPRDMLRCLRLKLWDEDRREMVGYPSRRSRAGSAGGTSHAAAT